MSKKNPRSPNFDGDFSFLGQPTGRQDATEPLAELPVIAPVVAPAPKPEAAKPAAPPPQLPVAPQPAAAAPPTAATTAAAATEATAKTATTATAPPASRHGRSSADVPVDFSFLGQSATQVAAEERNADDVPEVAAIRPPMSGVGAVESVPVDLVPEAPFQSSGQPELASAASLEAEVDSSEQENESRIGTLIEALEQPSEIPSMDQSTLMLPDTSDSEWVEDGTRPPENAEKDLTGQRSGPSPDFRGDFSFLNHSAEAPPSLPRSSRADRSPDDVEPEVSAQAGDAGATAIVVTADSPPGPSVAAATGRARPLKATPKAAVKPTAKSDPVSAEAEASAVPPRRANTISVPAWFPGYTAALTLLMLFLLFTGRIHLSSNHVLESLPDVRPLAANEFQEVKASQKLPQGHMLALGESRRFGDVVVTPLKVTREPLQFEDFLTGKPAPTLTTPPAFKLHLRFENVSGSTAFPPWDAALMSHRFPPFTDDLNTLANSFLSQVTEPADEFPERLLNYMQTMDSNFVLTGQNAGKVVAPGETLETWIASEPIPEDWNPKGPLRWRVQFRKGVNSASRNGVTTLIDVNFDVSEISG